MSAAILGIQVCPERWYTHDTGIPKYNQVSDTPKIASMTVGRGSTSGPISMERMSLHVGGCMELLPHDFTTALGGLRPYLLGTRVHPGPGNTRVYPGPVNDKMYPGIPKGWVSLSGPLRKVRA